LTKNLQQAGKILFMPLSKVWCSLQQFYEKL